jgi:hypothetical protein
MEVIIKRCVFTDEWFAPKPSRFKWRIPILSTWIKLCLPPRETPTQEFKNYALGFRFEPTPRELEIIQSNNLFGHPALKIRETDQPITFAEILGPEFVPELNPSQASLLSVEAKVRQAAITWSHFFKSLDGIE